jgi:hypothetical protein
MKPLSKLFVLPLLIIGLMFIYGCPVGMDYPPDEPGNKPVDEALVGTWNCVSDTCSDLKKVKIEKYDDYSYDITILETGSDYMADDDFFVGYVTEIDGYKLIFAEEQTSGLYYTYCYEISGNRLTIYDVGLLESGIDAAKSTDAFRKEISASLKKSGCLSSRLDFSRL